MATITVNRAPVEFVKMRDMPPGVFAEVMDCYEGSIVFRSYEGDIVCITAEGKIDGFGKDCPLNVRVLKPGESFTVNV